MQSEYVYKCSNVQVYQYVCGLFRFSHENPEDPKEVPKGFLSDINPVSPTVFLPRSLWLVVLVQTEPFQQHHGLSDRV